MKDTKGHSWIAAVGDEAAVVAATYCDNCVECHESGKKKKKKEKQREKQREEEKRPWIRKEANERPLKKKGRKK